MRRSYWVSGVGATESSTIYFNALISTHKGRLPREESMADIIETAKLANSLDHACIINYKRVLFPSLVTTDFDLVKRIVLSKLRRHKYHE